MSLSCGSFDASLLLLLVTPVAEPDATSRWCLFIRLLLFIHILQLLHGFPSKLALHIELSCIEASSIGLVLLLFFIVIIHAIPHDGSSWLLDLLFLFLLALRASGSAHWFSLLLRLGLMLRLLLLLLLLCCGCFLGLPLLLLLHHTTLLLLLTTSSFLFFSLLLLSGLLGCLCLCSGLLLSTVIATFIGWGLLTALPLAVIGKDLSHYGA